MLPDNDAVWPPVHLKGYYRQIERLAAWYSDDTDALYQFRTDAPSSLINSAVGWFGRNRARTVSPETIGRAHVPVAADIARTSADLLFGEIPSIEVAPATPDAEPDPKVQDRWEMLMDAMGYGSQLVEGGELCAALSGIYWRVTWAPQVVPDRPILTWIQPDMAAPEWAFGVLQAVTIWSVLPTPAGQPDTGVWRHLERHSVGQIEHGLYVGDKDVLGRRMPLDSHPMTNGIQVTDQDVITLPPGVPLTVGYIPNMRPNRQMRFSQFGRADIAGMTEADGPLAGLDKTWSSWMRDLDLGKGRAVIPKDFLRDLGPGQGAAFEVDRAVYDGLSMPPSSTGSPITVMQFAIRVDEHARTAAEQFAVIVRGAGYSLGSFGVQGDGPAVTATEQRARSALSMTTREKKTRYWDVGIREMGACILAMDAVLFGGPGQDAKLEVEFSPAVAEDPERVATTVNLLNQAAAASTRTRVELVHPDWDAARVDEEVALIKSDNSISVPDPIGAGELNPMMPDAPIA